MLTEKLEKLYQAVKEEHRTSSETMFHYQSNIPAKAGGRELQKPAEDFRKFKAGTTDVEVIINLFFPRFRDSLRRCQALRDRFVDCWYDLYNQGIEQDLVAELATAAIQLSNSYTLLECDIKFKAQALSSQQTATGIINTAFGDMIKGIAGRLARRRA